METPVHAEVAHASEDVLHRFFDFEERAVDEEAHPLVSAAVARGQAIRAQTASTLLSQGADHNHAEALSNGDRQEC